MRGNEEDRQGFANDIFSRCLGVVRIMNAAVIYVHAFRSPVSKALSPAALQQSNAYAAVDADHDNVELDDVDGDSDDDGGDTEEDVEENEDGNVEEMKVVRHLTRLEMLSNDRTHICRIGGSPNRGRLQGAPTRNWQFPTPSYHF